MNDATKAKVVAALQDQFGGGQDVTIMNFTPGQRISRSGSRPGCSGSGGYGLPGHSDLHLVSPSAR